MPEYSLVGFQMQVFNSIRAFIIGEGVETLYVTVDNFLIEPISLSASERALLVR